ncbi:MAG: hypothetical protein EBT06_12320 [Gammaproteobacteria bacterium]|nr:hypothetical protein [Gammaproteobacteria bacterium]NBY21617.1 hypothetical protein [Gammaproteobacteria bacterium]
MRGSTLDLKEVDPPLGQALYQAQDMGRLEGQGARVLRMLMAALIVLEGVKCKMRFRYFKSRAVRAESTLSVFYAYL